MQKAALLCIASAIVSTEMVGEGRYAASCGCDSLIEQEEAVRALIGRLLPDYRHLFRVNGTRLCGHDPHAAACCEVRVSEGLVYIQGKSGT